MARAMGTLANPPESDPPLPPPSGAPPPDAAPLTVTAADGSSATLDLTGDTFGIGKLTQPSVPGVSLPEGWTPPVVVPEQTPPAVPPLPPGELPPDVQPPAPASPAGGWITTGTITGTDSKGQSFNADLSTYQPTGVQQAVDTWGDGAGVLRLQTPGGNALLNSNTETDPATGAVTTRMTAQTSEGAVSTVSVTDPKAGTITYTQTDASGTHTTVTDLNGNPIGQPPQPAGDGSQPASPGTGADAGSGDSGGGD
jgi:hypothetical protein